MANESIVSGLFGLNPYQVQQQQFNALRGNAANFAQLNPEQRAAQMLYQGGGMLGGAAAEAIGFRNPDVELARQQQQIMNAGDVDISTPDGLKAKAAQFASAGDQTTAMKLIMLAQRREAEIAKIAASRAKAIESYAKANKEASPWAKFDPKDYTQESIQRFMVSNNPADLEALSQEGKFSSMARELIDAGYQYGTPEFAAEMKKRIAAETTGKAKGAGTTLVMPGNKDMKDIPAFRRDVQLTIKPQLETAYATDKALSALELAINGNPAAFAVARTQLAKAAGDSQISLREIEAAGGDPSIAGTIFNTASTLFTGTPTVELQMNMKRTLQAINKVAKAKARAEISAQKKLAKMSGYTDEQIDSALKFDDFEAKPGIGVGETRTLKSGKKVQRIN